MKKRILAIVLVIVMLVGVIASVIVVLNSDAYATRNNLVGDVNMDGSVDNLDAVQVLKYDVGLIELSAENCYLADVNLDGIANNLDASFILKYDAGVIDGFPERVTEESSAEISVEESSEENSIEISEESSEEQKPEIQYPEGAYVVKTYSDKNDIDWNEVEKANIDIYKWVDSVQYKAYAQLVYVEGYGFFCRMTCIEENPKADYTQFGDPVYLDSCMEFFASWDNQSYINIESNSLGTLCSQFGATQKNRKPITDYLSMDEIFEVNPVVEGDKWTLTMDIPISKLQKFYGSTMNEDTFVSGYTFRGNFYKIGSDAVTGVRHYGMWTEVAGSTPNFHQPDCFGTFVIE